MSKETETEEGGPGTSVTDQGEAQGSGDASQARHTTPRKTQEATRFNVYIYIIVVRPSIKGLVISFNRWNSA